MTDEMEDGIFGRRLCLIVILGLGLTHCFIISTVNGQENRESPGAEEGEWSNGFKKVH